MKNIFLVIILMLAGAVHAEVRLPSFFTDNMVLQRDIELRVWGWADVGESVSVRFAGQSEVVQADESGRWQLRLKAMAANAQPQVLQVNDLSIKNILIGDVWICSGQSNMEWTVDRSMNYKDEASNADFPQIRHIKIGHAAGDVPKEDIKKIEYGGWQVCTPQSVARFTAVGYYFGRAIHQEVGVPIGLIGTNWGGTRIETWISPEGYNLVPELQELAKKVNVIDPSTSLGAEAHVRSLQQISNWLPKARVAVSRGERPEPAPLMPTTGQSHQDPVRIFNEMVHPFIPFGIKGVIWYQGESNGSEGISYFHKKRALIEGWRKLWGQGDFPFYFVQLANFQQASGDPAGGDGWARVREAQRKSLEIKNTGMALAIDIGEANDIHPRNKQDVGKRLARWALARDYGRGMLPSGPLFKKVDYRGNKAIVSFHYTGLGLMVGEKNGLEPTKEVDDGELKQFALAGSDKQWHWADAKIEGDTVVLSSSKVSKPTAVRYAFRMNPEGANLYNREGLPAAPFDTGF